MSIEYRNIRLNELDLMCDLWNDVMDEEKFFAPFSHKEYQEKMMNNSDFDLDYVFGAFDDANLIGYSMGILRQRYKDNPNTGAYINAILVKKEYRHKGIGDKLLSLVEDKFRSIGKLNINASYFLPSCYEWYVPHTDKHNHPCAPGIRINSEYYFFLLHHGYESIAFEDAFHLDLKNYQISSSIQEILDKNKKEGITIELYNPKKHYGLEEFYKDINTYDFEKVIRENLELDKPYPFLVVSNNGKIVGWTGAMWNEKSGRGHFDGIIISPSVRGKGLGKALFSLLAYYSKQNGAEFMTFYTGLTNHARYIYMKAGFKIVHATKNLKVNNKYVINL